MLAPGKHAVDTAANLLDVIRAAGLSTESAVIVTNGDDLPKLHIIADGIVSTGTPLFKFE